MSACAHLMGNDRSIFRPGAWPHSESSQANVFSLLCLQPITLRQPFYSDSFIHWLKSLMTWEGSGIPICVSPAIGVSNASADQAPRWSLFCYAAPTHRVLGDIRVRSKCRQYFDLGMIPPRIQTFIYLLFYLSLWFRFANAKPSKIFFAENHNSIFSNFNIIIILRFIHILRPLLRCFQQMLSP